MKRTISQLQNIEEEPKWRLNTKAGFKKFIEKLGLPVAEYLEVSGLEKLSLAAENFLQKHPKIIIKLNRSSNGYGHFVFDSTQYPVSILSQKINEFYLNINQPLEFVIEEYLEGIATPSVEILVKEEGVKVLYVCDQRCINNAYTGMETPPTSVSTEILEKLHNIGDTFGRAVHRVGFREICDIDTCVKTKTREIYLSETNFRRTAGSFIDTLVRRLIKKDYYPDKLAWIQNTLISNKVTDFNHGINLLEENNLGFNKNTLSGVIFYVDTLEFDNKWRYLIITKNHAEAIKLEKQFKQVFL